MALTRRPITLDPIGIDGSASTATQLRVTPFPPYPSGGGEMVSGEAFTYDLPLDEDATIVVPGNYQFELLSGGQTLGRTWSSGVPEGASPIALDTLYRSTAGAVTATPVPLRVGDAIGLLSSGDEAAGRRVVTDGDGGFTYADASGGDGDMTKAVYDTDDDGIVDHAALADSATTATTAATATNATQLGGQTSAYHLARTNHTGAQAISTVTGLQTALDGKAAAVHTHTIADTTGLQAALDAKAAASDLTAEASARASADAALTTAVAAKADASDLAAHTGNTSNPHGVTASQVGKDTAQWNADRLDGVAVTGTPASGDVLTATGPTAATWSAPSGGGGIGIGDMVHWAAARLEATTRKVRVWWYGDSLSNGVAADDYYANGWPALVRQALQTLYNAPSEDEDDSSGWRPVYPSTAFSLTEAESARYSAYINTGSWIGENNLFTGRGGSYIRSGSTGAEASFMLLEGEDEAYVTYGILSNYYSGDPSFWRGAVFEVRLDGNLVMEIDSRIDPATDAPSDRFAVITRTVATNIGPGPHTITVTHIGNPDDTSLTNFQSVLFGVGCEDATGIIVDVFARHGATSYVYGGAVDDADMNSPLWVGNFDQPSRYVGEWERYDIDGNRVDDSDEVDLLIWALGVNDIADTGGTLEAYRDNLTRWLQTAYAASSISRSASLLLIQPSQGTATQTFPADDLGVLDARIAARHRGVFLEMEPDPVGFDWAAHFAGALDAASGDVHVNNTGARLYADAVTAILTA